jgi:hypothetical protein
MRLWGDLLMQNVNLIVKLDFELAMYMMQGIILRWYVNMKG